MIDEAARMADVDEQAARCTPRSTPSSARTSPTSRWSITKFYFLHGSNITGYVNAPATNGYPDLGASASTQ